MSENILKVALEVFTNPGDICIYISERDSQYLYVISRGLGDNYELLKSSKPVFGTSIGAIRAVEGILKKFCEIATEVIVDSNNPLYHTFNPENKPVAEMNVLTDDLIEKIITALKNFNEADTNKILVPTPP